MTPLQILAPIRIELTYDMFKGLRHSNVHIDQHMEHQNGGVKENLRAARGKSFSLQNLSYLRVFCYRELDAKGRSTSKQNANPEGDIGGAVVLQVLQEVITSFSISISTSPTVAEELTTNLIAATEMQTGGSRCRRA